MKHMKKFVALALVLVSILAIAGSAMAAAPYETRYSNVELYTNTPAGYSWAIRNLQRDLNIYDSNNHLKVDGYFGQKTKAAVMRFQQGQGLNADGRVGSLTKQALWTYFGY